MHYAPNSRSVETRSAEFGSTVVMKCQAELAPPASFTWMKQDGQLPFQAAVNEVRSRYREIYDHRKDGYTIVKMVIVNQLRRL